MTTKTYCNFFQVTKLVMISQNSTQNPNPVLPPQLATPQKIHHFLPKLCPLT